MKHDKNDKQKPKQFALAGRMGAGMTEPEKKSSVKRNTKKKSGANKSRVVSGKKRNRKMGAKF
jgi:hypothetical protein